MSRDPRKQLATNVLTALGLGTYYGLREDEESYRTLVVGYLVAAVSVVVGYRLARLRK
ncbi:hypothetical protein [Halomarina ordinaria]|uniref:AtpZ/AtpI family protein n=1 Tax=Halomarina ordinaria TaxID=3033939 RepID=A0ABD5U9V2_9EURY|nr:hypothetical protein [Halomarina sp. PSRA2]